MTHDAPSTHDTFRFSDVSVPTVQLLQQLPEGLHAPPQPPSMLLRQT